jgi:pilus assembly protein CpaE
MVALPNPESLSLNALAVLLVSSSETRRKALASALAGNQARVIREAGLPAIDTLPSLVGHDCDVLIVDLLDEPERGLDLIEAACALDSGITVMAYGRSTDPELLMRCMRAGARELLGDPISTTSVAEALVRAAARKDEVKRQKKREGRCLAFVGAKGGSGVTTVAANFAVQLARENAGSVVLVDLEFHMGDAALDLGLSGEFSAMDALENEHRLDSELVSKLLVRHSSGLHVLAAPDRHNTFQPTQSGVLKLIDILRRDFAWVVVDAGTRYWDFVPSLFQVASKVYLVTQVSVAELRNSNRIIAALFQGAAAGKLDVVLNRYAPAAGEIDEASIEKALTISPAWKIPSDYAAVRTAQNTATALALRDGPITRVITSMARTACGKTAPDVRKKRFSLW